MIDLNYITERNKEQKNQKTRRVGEGVEPSQRGHEPSVLPVHQPTSTQMYYYIFYTASLTNTNLLETATITLVIQYIFI